MNKNRTRDLLRIAFAMFMAAIVTMIGCAGGGGGDGRQVLPGENPVGPVIITGTGTGTSTGTGTGTGTSTGTGTGTGTGTSVEEKVDNAWTVMDSQNWGGAMLHFTDVLNDSRSTPVQRQQAYNGRAWAKVKYYSTIEGLNDFNSAIQLGEKDAASYKESLLGYALALIQTGGTANIRTAVQILAVQLQLADPQFVMTLEHQSIGVSSPEAHAMLAYAYFWRNDDGDAGLAKAQIERARVDDPSTGGIVNQVYTTLKAAGLDI